MIPAPQWELKTSKFPRERRARSRVDEPRGVKGIAKRAGTRPIFIASRRIPEGRAAERSRIEVLQMHRDPDPAPASRRRRRDHPLVDGAQGDAPFETRRAP